MRERKDREERSCGGIRDESDEREEGSRREKTGNQLKRMD